jgi:hypothetical protein
MSVAGHLVGHLRAGGDPAFAVLDAARDMNVLATLIRSGVTHTSLYEGWQGAALCDVAPYLVPLALDGPLIAPIAGEWWGRACGIIVTSRVRPEYVRARLRRLLMVRTPNDRTMYFRFYDPRVLRVFLPIANPGQIQTFFGDGEVTSYLAEGDDPREMLVFTEAARGTLEMRNVVLDGKAKEMGDGRSV